MSDASLKSGGGIRLTKEERKELLARLERQSSRAEPPERILQRGRQALKDGQLDRARRVLKQLETAAPSLAGLDLFSRDLEAASRREKRLSNLHATEEMLARYIQQRKKTLAELALETLLELAPDHPRRDDYTKWVADLDRELEVQKRIDGQLAAGREALAAGDFTRAEERLGALRRIEPDSSSAAQLAAELLAAAQSQAMSAEIEAGKQRLEELLSSGRLDEAEEQMERLSGMDLPKVTLDFLRQRLDERRRRLRDQAQADRLIAAFDRHLEARDWPSAREVAQQYGRRFPSGSRAAEMFNRVNELEASERRRQSVEEGLATLERFLAEGDRHNAELALRLLASLDVGEERLAQLRARLEDVS